jgi:hypothetical protein
MKAAITRASTGNSRYFCQYSTITEAMAPSWIDLEAFLELRLREAEQPARQYEVSGRGNRQELGEALTTPKMMLCSNVMALFQTALGGLVAMAKGHRAAAPRPPRLGVTRPP